ncbi:MAG: hypothetical protein H7338_00620 [Candidatus Sericytochromatia bacterium]|nr:hypothetical protein [Candidatus Sericytochromatia bacterium]
MKAHFLSPWTAVLAVAVAITAGLNASADPPGHDHHAQPAAPAGHDHGQHGHSRILKLGTVWEAGLDITDWHQSARACPAHPQIVSNRVGSHCPITTTLMIDRPTTVPQGAAKRIGLVLLPASGHKHPIADAQIQVTGPGTYRLGLKQKDGYYWADLPAAVKGPLTLLVQQGGKSQQVSLGNL